MIRIRHKGFALTTIVIFLVEVLIATILKHTFLRPVFGDFLVVILIYSFIRTFFSFSSIKVGIGVLLFAGVVEFVQYVNILEKIGLQKSTTTDLTLGSTFDWLDILAYALGIVFIVSIDLVVLRIKRKKSLS